MSLLDIVRRSLSSEPGQTASSGASRAPRPALPPPLPMSAFYERARGDAAIDRTIDIIEAAVLPSAKPPRASRAATDSQPTRNRQDSGSEPTPPRRRSGGKSASRKKAADSGLKPEQFVIGMRSDPSSAREHAAALLHFLIETVGCAAGSEVTAETMQTTYWHHVCPAHGWQWLAWPGKNGVGKHLRELCGGKKVDRDVPKADRHLPDGRVERTYSKKRVYVLPRWSDVPTVGPGPAGEASNVTPITAGRRKGRKAA